MSLRSVDLNLIPMLQALLSERSISRAAESCGLSQSAMSDVLRRLRIALNDPLLVRVGRRMELTPQAAELIGPLDAICSGLEGFYSNQHFDPLTAERTFVIASTDHTIMLMAGPWLAELDRVAPRIQLRFVETSAKIVERLCRREVDFAVLPSYYVQGVSLAPICFRPLMRDYPVALFRRGHPLCGRKSLSRADLLPFRLISFASSRSDDERENTDPVIGDPKFDIIAYMAYITVPPYLLLESDYFTITSSSVAHSLVKLLPLETCPITFGGQMIEMGLAWSPVQDSSPAHRWFRDMAERVVKASDQGRDGLRSAYAR